MEMFPMKQSKVCRYNMIEPRADCDAPCFDQLKATHLRASPKQQALLDVLLQLIKNMAAHNRSLKNVFFCYSLYVVVLHKDRL